MISERFMRMTRTIRLFFLFIFLCAAGCAAPQEGSETAETAVSTNTGLKSSAPTRTPEPTETAVPPTNTPEPAPSDTPEAEVEDEVADAQMDEDEVVETAVPPTATSTKTPIPPTPTITPTSEPLFTPEFSRLLPEGSGAPTAVPEFDVPEGATTVVLLGNDGGVNTDTIILVAINREGPTASMLSIPRDLYVYIPEVGMGQINTVVARGGPDLLKQTIQYNFGVPVNFYAQIDFDGFEQMIDVVDGVDIAVSCRLQDWRLISPELDPEDEDNWEQFALEPGVYEMDGDLALWYARSRKTTSDFDRGRRQQQLLRGLFNRAVDVGLITEFPTLWSTYNEFVDTDMDIGRILQLATLAPAIRDNGVQHLYLAGKTEPATTSGGVEVMVPVWEGERMMGEEFSRLFLPPALNMAAQPPVVVEIVNASDDPDLTLLAIDNLAWFGFTAVIADPTNEANQLETTNQTTLNYYKPNFKGSYDWLISWVFDMRQSEIELVEDEDFPHEYQLIIGKDYDPCRPQMFAPQLFLTTQNQ